MTSPRTLTQIVALVVLSLGFLGCERCPDTPLRTTVFVHVPHPSLVPRHCTGARESTCRDADRVLGLTYAFDFESHVEGGLWCSFPKLEGVIRTRSCEALELPAPSESGELHLDVQDCDLGRLGVSHVGERCEVRSRDGVPYDSCGEGLFCRAHNARCAQLPTHCERDLECSEVFTCDDTGLCVRFACDTSRGECVWPDECFDTSDCQRSHSRCDAQGHCDTFTCETGRCVGIPSGER